MNLSNWRKHTKLYKFNMTMLLYPVERRRGRRILYIVSLKWLYQSELMEMSFKLILQLSFPVRIAMICKLCLGIYCFIKLYTAASICWVFHDLERFLLIHLLWYVFVAIVWPIFCDLRTMIIENSFLFPVADVQSCSTIYALWSLWIPTMSIACYIQLY